MSNTAPTVQCIYLHCADTALISKDVHNQHTKWMHKSAMTRTQLKASLSPALIEPIQVSSVYSYVRLTWGEILTFYMYITFYLL